LVFATLFDEVRMNRFMMAGAVAAAMCFAAGCPEPGGTTTGSTKVSTKEGTLVNLKVPNMT
jgi:hypothetical protein